LQKPRPVKRDQPPRCSGRSPLRSKAKQPCDDDEAEAPVPPPPTLCRWDSDESFGRDNSPAVARMAIRIRATASRWQ